MRVNFIFHLYTNMYFIFAQLLFLGSLVLSLAHGRAGARATFPSFYYKSPASPAEWASKQASKKEGGLGEGIFARLLSAPKARSGWEAARPVSKEAKPAKIVSLIEKNFLCPPIKRKRNFCGLCLPPSGGSKPLGGQSAKSSGFCLKKVRISFSVRSHIGNRSQKRAISASFWRFERNYF